jgi:hypothetical protein
VSHRLLGLGHKDNFNKIREEFIHMRIVEDKDGERFLELESKEDLEEFRKMLIAAYYELRSQEKAPS